MSDANAIRAGKAFVEIYADSSKLNQGLKASLDAMKEFGRSVAVIGAGITAAGVGMLAPFIKAAKDAVEMGFAYEKTARRLGVTAAEVSTLGFAAELTGTSMENLERGIFIMNRNIGYAALGSRPAIKAIENLGLSVDKLSKMPTIERLYAISDAISSMTDETKKAGYGFAIMSDAFRELMPMLRDGSGYIKDLQGVSSAYGFSLSPQTITNLAAIREAWLRIGIAISGVKASVTDILSSSITKISLAIARVVASVNKILQKNPEIITTLTKIGIALTVVGGAITAVGVAIVGTAVAISSLSVIATAASTAIATGMAIVTASVAAMSAAIGFIISGISLIASLPLATMIAVVVVGAGSIIMALRQIGGVLKSVGGTVAGVFERVRDYFATIGTEARETYRAVAHAIGQGGIEAAIKVVWATVEYYFVKGKVFILDILTDIKVAMMDIVIGILEMISKGVSKAISLVKNAYLEIVKLKGLLPGEVKNTLNETAGAFSKILKFNGGLMSSLTGMRLFSDVSRATGDAMTGKRGIIDSLGSVLLSPFVSNEQNERAIDIQTKMHGGANYLDNLLSGISAKPFDVSKTLGNWLDATHQESNATKKAREEELKAALANLNAKQDFANSVKFDDGKGNKNGNPIVPTTSLNIPKINYERYGSYSASMLMRAPGMVQDKEKAREAWQDGMLQLLKAIGVRVQDISEDVYTKFVG